MINNSTTIECYIRAVDYAFYCISEMDSTSDRLCPDLIKIKLELLEGKWDPDLPFIFSRLCESIIFSNQLVLQNLTAASQSAHNGLSSDFAELY